MRRKVLAVAMVLSLPASVEAKVDPLVPVTGASPFAAACNGAAAPQGSVEYRGTEVEPWIDANPTDSTNLAAMWQQDRYSDGGANGLGIGVSRNGGASWTQVPPANLPKFSRCQGAAAGGDGDYERASDPWLSFGPDGHLYSASLSFNVSRDLANAILVSESLDGGATWSPVHVIRRDTSATVFNDKQSITADYTDGRYAYVVWDRIEDFPDGSNRSPTWFARTTDGGATWETAQPIFDPGANDGTVGNQIVVMPDGDLVNGYSLVKDGVRSVAVMRSTDKGASWAPQVVVGSHETVGVRDPTDGAFVRTGDIIPELASDERAGTDTVYMVWQDARFSGGQYDQIAFSKSTNGGITWSVPKRISTAPATFAFTPAIRVDAAGSLGVTYYDFRNDAVSSPALSADVWSLRSTDGGSTFTEERLTPTSFDMRLAPVARGFFVGDYAGLAAVGQTFKPLFSQAASGGTDVFSTTVRGPFVSGAVPSGRRGATPAPPAKSTPRPVEALRVAKRGRLGRRFASFLVRCLQPRCRAQLELSAVLRYRGKRRPVILGSRSFRIRKGRARLRVRLNRRARRLTARRTRLSTRAVFTMRADRVESRVLLRRR
jgi:hypothetical protein